MTMVLRGRGTSSSGGADIRDRGRAIQRILLVDDEDSMRAGLAYLLTNHGYEVHEASNGFDARRLLGELRFDLLLTDVAMPGITGLDLLAEAKARDARIEVILITAHMDISYAIQAMREGAWDFFTKPFNLEKILLTIARVDEKRRYQEKAQQYEMLRRQKEVEDQAVLETTLGLARAVEERDKYNIGHGKRTANYALILGRRLRFTDERLRLLRYGGLLHDVGKIGIDDRILNKPGRLTEEEYVAIRRHPEIGEYILKPISLLRDVSGMVRHHHERWDGDGYPDGLEGEKIPLDARILCIADYFDSITSARPYRKPMTVEEATRQMLSERGRAFDPLLTDLFLDEITRSQSA